MTPPFRRIVLTGASGGLGLALARRLAAPGATLLLTGRDAARLAQAAQAVAAAGGRAETARADVTDAAAMARVLIAFDEAGPVDLLVANAGVSAGTRAGGAMESAAEARGVIEANLLGMLNTVDPLRERMAARGGGTIAVMSSLAGLRPLPDMPSYSASKAAVRAYGVALRGALRPSGVRVCVICPGFVTSPMSARHRGFKPFEIDADRAAAIMARGLARGAAHVTFPWPLAAMTWLDARLPAGLSDWFARGFRAEIAPEQGDRTRPLE
jgi:short-subunit dehydrogenase